MSGRRSKERETAVGYPPYEFLFHPNFSMQKSLRRLTGAGRSLIFICMNAWNQYALAVSKLLGISHGQVVLVAVLLFFALLFAFRRNFWGTFKFLAIVGILGAITYHAYNFTMISLQKRDALVNKRVEIDDGKP